MIINYSENKNLFSIFRICLSGETGRHSGLKIRRLSEKRRTGSIPVSGTNSLLEYCFFVLLNYSKLRILIMQLMSILLIDFVLMKFMSNILIIWAVKIDYSICQNTILIVNN